MASRDYRYIGYEDENNITEIILYAMPKVVQARKERERYLESRALSASSPTDAERVQGGADVTRAQRYMEGVEDDQILHWLSMIETRVCERVMHLSAVDKAFLKECYFSGRLTSCYAAGKALGMPSSSAKDARRRIIRELKRGCTSVYHYFCLWREQDDIDLDKRKNDLDGLINGAA